MMNDRNKTFGPLSRADVAVVIVCILFLVATGYAADSLLREYERRVACGANLRALATAQTIYANDYEDEFAVQGRGLGRWGKTTPDWYDPDKEWKWGADNELTVGASLYLLVREADVDPEKFVCPGSSEKPFDGSNPNEAALEELWDFGAVDYGDTGPKNCVSYSYQQPYSPFSADSTKSWAYAVMSDKSPWYDSSIRKGTPSDSDWKEHVGYIFWNDAVRGDRDWQLRVGNSQRHWRDGQNVMFTDGHVEFVLRPDVGVKHDNIFTPAGGPDSSIADYVRIGQMPVPYGIGYGEPTTSDDSFLVNDDENNPCYADQPGDMNGDCNVDVQDLAVISEHWLESTRVED
jgi:hypothetical protein